jgi:hypothetical protein
MGPIAPYDRSHYSNCQCDRRNSHSSSTQRQANSGARSGRRQDILIGGTTDYDQNDEALQAILAEWSARRSYDTRTQNISGSGARSLALNADFILDSLTVHDDGFADDLRGGGGLDWFFGTIDGSMRDEIRGKNSAELVELLVLSRRRGERVTDS